MTSLRGTDLVFETVEYFIIIFSLTLIFSWLPEYDPEIQDIINGYFGGDLEFTLIVVINSEKSYMFAGFLNY